VVVAAGNDGRDNSMGTNGYSTITSPGNDPAVITVGAMKDMGTISRGDDLIASYSSKGPTLLDQVAKPDIVAPGNGIISALAANSGITASFPNNIVPISYYKSSGSGAASPQYFKLSGTSMATPMVSGAAALLIQKDSTLTPDTVKAHLMKTSSKSFPGSSSVTDPTTGITYTSYYDLFTIGAGYLDVWAALNCTDIVPSGSTASSPTVQYDATTKTVKLVSGTNIVWGSNIVWGDNVVWGSNVVWGDNVVWGSNVVWGDSTLQGFNVVWGSNIVWGSSDPFVQSVAITGER
jgi:serine protease AprX